MNSNNSVEHKKQVWKGSTLLAPVPSVIVTCGTLERANALTIAWTGIICSQPPKTYISLRPERYSYPIIEKNREFAINLTTAEMVRCVDYCGVRSGKNEDKLKNLSMNILPASRIAAPILEASPLSLECKVFDIVKLGSHDMFLADIVAIDVDERYIDKNGKLSLDKCNLIAYSHGEYYTLGKKLGTFGYSVKRRKTHSK